MSQRAEITAVRDTAERAAAGDETAAQWLYGAFGALTKDQFSGLVIGLNFALSHVDFKDEQATV